MGATNGAPLVIDDASSIFGGAREPGSSVQLDESCRHASPHCSRARCRRGPSPAPSHGPLPCRRGGTSVMRTVRLTRQRPARSSRPSTSARIWPTSCARSSTLTATHLRCEQGVCGACTLLIDGQPARSCITYAALCEGADVTTLEGLEHDPVIAALRRAFMAEHGLQCGFCTPGMLVTARDIVTRAAGRRRRARAPGAERQPVPLHGLCRHRARHPPRARRAQGGDARRPLPPPASGSARSARGRPSLGDRFRQHVVRPPAGATPAETQLVDAGALGLGAAAPNIELRQSFTVAQPPDARSGASSPTSSGSCPACRALR